MHARGGGDVADGGAVEALLAEQARADAQQRFTPAVVLRFLYFCRNRGRFSGASIAIPSSCAATFLPRLSMRMLRAAPPCSAPFSTILRAGMLSSGQSSTRPVLNSAKRVACRSQA